MLEEWSYMNYVRLALCLTAFLCCTLFITTSIYGVYRNRLKTCLYLFLINRALVDVIMTLSVRFSIVTRVRRASRKAEEYVGR